MPYKKFIKDIGIMGLTQSLSAVGGIITLPVITKLLGARDYGIWVQLLITISLISTIAPLCLPYALVRFLSSEKDKEKIRDGIWSSFAIILAACAAASLILILLSGKIADFWGCPKLFIYILSIIILFECLNQVHYNLFRAFRKTARFCTILITQELSKAGFVILAVYLGYGLLGALLAFLIVRSVGFLVMNIYVLKEIGFKIPKFLQTKEYLSFGLPGILDSASNWVIQSSDRYLIGFFLGTLFVGYYAPPYSISVFVINFLVAPFSFLLPAILSKSYDENKVDEVKTYLKYSLKYFLLIAIPAAFGLSILSNQILTIFTTREFAASGYLVMPIISFSMLAMGVNAIIAQIIGITKKTKISALFTGIAAALNVVLNFIFIPKFGIVGAAITTLIAFVFLLLSIGIFCYKYIKFDIDWKFILKSVFASIVMAAFVIWLKPAGATRTIISIILAVPLYVILIFILKSFDAKEISLFKKILKRN